MFLCWLFWWFDWCVLVVRGFGLFGFEFWVRASLLLRLLIVYLVFILLGWSDCVVLLIVLSLLFADD